MKLVVATMLVLALQISNCSGEDYFDKALAAVPAMPSPSDRTQVLRRLVVDGELAGRKDIADQAASQAIASCKAIPEGNTKASFCISLYNSLIATKRYEGAKQIEDDVASSIDNLWDFIDRWLNIMSFFGDKSARDPNTDALKRRLITIFEASVREEAGQILNNVQNLRDLAIIYASVGDRAAARKALSSAERIARNSIISDLQMGTVAVGHARVGDYEGARRRARLIGGAKMGELLARMAKEVAENDPAEAQKFLQEAISHHKSANQFNLPTAIEIMEAQLLLGDKTAARETAATLTTASDTLMTAYEAFDTLAELEEFDVIADLRQKYGDAPATAARILAELAADEYEAGRHEEARNTGRLAIRLSEQLTEDYEKAAIYQSLARAHMHSEVATLAEQLDGLDRQRALFSIALSQAASGDESGYLETIRKFNIDDQMLGYVQIRYIEHLLRGNRRDIAIQKAEEVGPGARAMAYLLIGNHDAGLSLDEIR